MILKYWKIISAITGFVLIVGLIITGVILSGKNREIAPVSPPTSNRVPEDKVKKDVQSSHASSEVDVNEGEIISGYTITPVSVDGAPYDMVYDKDGKLILDTSSDVSYSRLKELGLPQEVINKVGLPDGYDY